MILAIVNSLTFVVGQTLVLVESPTELTTSATDAVLAVECVICMAFLGSKETAGSWRPKIWLLMFGLLSISYLLGALAHGLELKDSTIDSLWKPVYFSLAVQAAIFFVAAVADLHGWKAAKRLLPWSVGVAIAFFGYTQLLSGEFVTIIVYEAFALICALGIYIHLATTNRVSGAAAIALSILLNLTAAAVQMSDLSLEFLWSFDNNGLFHLIQMLATALLWLGVSMGMKSTREPAYA